LERNFGANLSFHLDQNLIDGVGAYAMPYRRCYATELGRTFMTTATLRLHHLDFLRAAMMFLGVLVHASHADYDLGDFELVRFLSGSFRMPCFFIIAGFFSLLVLEKKGVSDFLRKRLVMLGVPALTCVLILVPITVQWMTVYFTEGKVATEPHSGWMGHAWFLFVLIIYTIVIRPLVYAMDVIVNRTARVIGNIAAQAAFFLVLVLGVMFVSKVIQKFGPNVPYYETWKFLVSSTIGNLPHFVLGLMMYRWANVYGFLHKNMWAWIVLALLGVTVKHQLAQYEITSTLQHLQYMVVSYSTAYAVSAALFSISSRLLTTHNAAIRLFSESAYTVYIVHYFFIAGVLVLLQRLDVNLLLRMLIAFAVASVFGVLLHVFLVRKVAVASLLFNGKFRSAGLA